MTCHSFVICDEGYTIERLIHGMNEGFNDIQPWHFKELVNVFGAKEGEPRTYQVKTKEQTNKLFDDKEFNSATNLQFVELYMPKQDTPRALMLIAVTSARINAKQ